MNAYFGWDAEMDDEETFRSGDALPTAPDQPTVRSELGAAPSTVIGRSSGALEQSIRPIARKIPG